MAHGDAREGKWKGNWRMEWVASTLHTTSEHGVSSMTTADAHTSAASSRLNWSPRRFKWTRPFRRKTKSVFCACVVTFQLVSTAGRVNLAVTVLVCVCRYGFQNWPGFLLSHLRRLLDIPGLFNWTLKLHTLLTVYRPLFIHDHQSNRSVNSLVWNKVLK
jgi:hypothetical protein